MRYVCAAYSEQLTLRDNRKCLGLIQSPDYQSYWGDVFELDKNEQSKHKFANLSTGFKLATAVGGSATGERGDRVIIDDPHNVKDSESEAANECDANHYNAINADYSAPLRPSRPATGRHLPRCASISLGRASRDR